MPVAQLTRTGAPRRAAQQAGRGRRRWLSLDQSNPAVPYLLLLPHAVFFIWFFVYPVFQGFVISLQRWNPLQESQPFVGTEHYANLADSSSVQFGRFWESFGNTVLFVVASVPLIVGVALGLALLLHRPVPGRAFFRSVFFLPTILSVTVISFLWRWIFNDRIGLLSLVLTELDVPPVSFLTTEWLAWVPILLATVWWMVGLNMVLYLAGLAGIPTAYYEAAQLDGAGAWTRFRYITLPLLRPTTLFVSVTTVVLSFQLFGQAQLITRGGPGRSTESVMMYITEEAFTNGQFSSAAAMSFVFGAAMLVVTAVQFRAMTSDIARPPK